MNNKINIPPFLMLLVYLASWLLLHVAPSVTEYVVLKKDCARKEARTKLAADAKKLIRTTQHLSSSENEQPNQQKPELKVCSITLALPPADAALSGPVRFNAAEPIQVQDHSYVYLSTSREPDPPRFA